jgi:hypothetical protein
MTIYVNANSELPMCGYVTRSWRCKHIQEPLDHLKPVQVRNEIILALEQTDQIVHFSLRIW